MTKFKVGDRVRVRAWEDMVKDFGLDKDGGIACRPYFVKMMKKYCGKLFTIGDIKNERYEIKECKTWVFSDDMLEKVEFTLSDLENEMIIELQNGRTYVKIGEVMVNERGFMRLSNYTEDMKDKDGMFEYDFKNVYPKSGVYGSGIKSMLNPKSEPIWTARNRIEIPEPDRTILQNIDERLQWIARDKNGKVFVYEIKPDKGRSVWNGNSFHCLDFFSNSFQFVQWEDKEPVNFRKVLKGE